MRRWGIALLIIGMCVCAFPQLQFYYEDMQQQKLLALLNEYTDEAAEATAEAAPLVYSDSTGDTESSGPETNIPASEPVKDSAAIEPVKPVKTAVQSTKTDTMAKAPVKAPAPLQKKPTAAPAGIGILEISKINLKMPILEGASNSNLNIGAAHLTGTAAIGSSGNTVIAAHHSYKYGRMFNRLNELAAGDLITLQKGSLTLQYKVTGSQMVEPTDISVLNQPAQGKHLTLITCDSDGSHRLVVHAEMQ